VRAAFFEIGQIAVRQPGEMLPHVRLRQFDERAANGVADAARPGVQHQPHALGLIEAHLDEVIAGAQRTQVLVVVGALQARVFLNEALEARQQYRPVRVDPIRRVLPTAFVTPAATDRAPVRYGALDGTAQAMQIVGQVGGVQRRARGDHPAADVHAHRRRDDRAARRDDAAYRRALAEMYIRHHRQMAEDERQARGIDQLLTRFLLDRHAFGPHLDRRSAGHPDGFDRRFRGDSLFHGLLLASAAHTAMLRQMP
jgi:hypothetical protein